MNNNMGNDAIQFNDLNHYSGDRVAKLSIKELTVRRGCVWGVIVESMLGRLLSDLLTGMVPSEEGEIRVLSQSAGRRRMDVGLASCRFAFFMS